MTKLQALKNKYSARYKDHLHNLALELEKHIKSSLEGEDRIDRTYVRAKSAKSFCEKAQKKENGKLKYSDPISQIQDQLGARIITFYPSDVERISKVVERYYRPIQKLSIVPDTEREFGYEGKHYVMFVPEAIFPKEPNDGNYPKFFELQIRTLFQHAWSEAQHDLGYKPSRTLESEEKRRMAFTAAQAWGADNILQQLFTDFKKRKNGKKPRSSNP